MKGVCKGELMRSCPHTGHCLSFRGTFLAPWQIWPSMGQIRAIFLFKSDSVHLGSPSSPSPNVLNLTWKKIPGFVPLQPIWSTLRTNLVRKIVHPWWVHERFLPLEAAVCNFRLFPGYMQLSQLYYITQETKPQRGYFYFFENAPRLEYRFHDITLNKNKCDKYMYNQNWQG